MKLWASVAVVCLSAVISRAEEKPEAIDPVVGKWEVTDGEIKGSVFDIAKTGDLKVTLKVGDTKAAELTGKVKVLSPDTMEMTIKGPDGKEQTEKLSYKIEGGLLAITGPDKKTVKFAKMK